MRREPDPNQPDRCPSIDPYGTLQCGRSLHDDDQCQLGGIAWKKDSQPEISDRERADRLEALCDRLAGRLANEHGRAAQVLIATADAWRNEGRAVMFNRDRDDLSPQQRVEKWLRLRAAATDQPDQEEVMSDQQRVERVGDNWAATCDHGDYVWYLERRTEYNAWRSLRAHTRHVHAAATDDTPGGDK